MENPLSDPVKDDGRGAAIATNGYLDVHQIATRIDDSSVVLHALASTFMIWFMFSVV